MIAHRSLVCWLLLLLPLAAVAAEGPVFLWHAEKDGATLHLLGSIHAGKDAWYPLDDRIEEAFAGADTVACELNIADMAVAMEVAGLAMQEGMYPDGETLTQHISAETWQKLQAVQGLPVPASMLERMRPGLAAMMVAQAMMARAGLDPQQGVDMQLLQRAAAAERPIVSLETPEEQVGLIFGPDAVIDELMLAEALDETPESMIAILDELVAAWQAGDPAAMEAAYREQWRDDERMVRFHEELLVVRNERMAANLDRRRGDWFVVVGALHLCGDEGIPTLLREAGWSVAQVGVGVLAR